MLNSPFYLLTLLTMILSTIAALSSTNWLLVWTSMELNLLSFIPMILSTKMNQETEGAIKYFLPQALGSAIMLLTSIMMWHPHTHLIPSILTLSLILKLGAAPCHFWFPQVMSSVSWMNCLLLATWQKFAPLFILAYLLKPVSQQLIYFIAVANALTGGLMGLNQSNLRTLMAYSSITHMAWMLSPLCMNCPCLTSMYFLLYCFLTIPIFTTFALNHQSTPNQLMNLHPLVLISTSILLLSLAGVPPLTGFFPKWILIQWLTWKYYAALLIFMLLGSFMNLYFYLTLMFNMLITPITNSMKLKSLDYIQPFMISSSLLGLLVMMTPYALTIFYKS